MHTQKKQSYAEQYLLASWIPAFEISFLGCLNVIATGLM